MPGKSQLKRPLGAFEFDDTRFATIGELRRHQNGQREDAELPSANQNRRRRTSHQTMSDEDGAV